MHMLSVDAVSSYLKLFPIKKLKMGRPSKKSDEWYITQIFKVLRTGMQWESIGTDEIHYTTIYKRFKLYSDNHIFQKAFEYYLIKLRKKGIYLFSKKINKAPLGNLSIDTTLIKNIRGIDSLGKNSCDRGRNGVKVSLIVTQSAIPIGITSGPANRHDSKYAVQTIKAVPIKIKNTRLLADKAYNSQPLKKNLKKDHNLTLLFPLKKNQKGKKLESKRKLDILKSRNSVERVFGWVKSFRRIILRYESKMNNYMQFWFLAILEILLFRIK